MKAEVDQSLCIGCGMCTAVEPNVFKMGDEGTAIAYGEVTDENIAAAKDAESGCPVAAISVEE